VELKHKGPRKSLEGAIALSYEQSKHPELGRAPQTRIRGKEINVGEIQKQREEARLLQERDRAKRAELAAQAAADAERTAAEQAAREAAKQAERDALLEAEQKAARDARYAARKATKKQRRRGY
jgi:Family of unknown function (DUF6481)